MFKLTVDELSAVIYSELRKRPYGNDLEVSQICAISVLEEELKKEKKLLKW